MSVASHRRTIRAARREDHVQALTDAWLHVPYHERVAFQARYQDLHAAVSRLTAHQVATRREPKEQHMNRIAPYWKAVVAFITPGVVGLVAAVQDGSAGGSAVTGPEWVGIGAACILTAGGVYAAKNAPKES